MMQLDYTLLAPRYWLWWLAFALLWLVTRLPYRWQVALGTGIGNLAYRLAKRRRRIAEINLRRCFPEHSEAEHQALLKQHFQALGVGLLETLDAWWMSDARLRSLGHVTGEEHLHAALARGQGVILLSAHFTFLEMGTRFITMRHAIHATYRQHENPVVAFFMRRSRAAHAEKAIPREAVRDMLQSLKANKPLWFAMDQNFGHKNSVFAPFFGIPAATNTATARIARISGAAVLPLHFQRLPDGKGYQVVILPALTQFPSGDEVADASRINHLIEEQIRPAPQYYFWVHRRFKDRPAGEVKWY